MSWWYENEAETSLLIRDYDKEKGWHYRPIKEREMEFDKSRVYTALNADELKAGDKVIVADQLSVLKQRVQEGKENSAVVLQKINGEDWGRRFCLTISDFALAYLVERKENCTNCDCCVCAERNWATDLANERIYCCPRYKPKTEKKEMCLNCKHYNKVNDFRDCTLVNNPTAACPHYEADKHYRPFKNTDELIKVWEDKLHIAYMRTPFELPLIWVRNKRNKKPWLINEFDQGILDYLFTNCEFLDGSVCGVEE